MNSRATQIPHLALGPGHDLPAAAFAAVTGLPVRPRPAVTNEDTIALFPQEWNRDPASPLIRSGAYHDVPWESPPLVRAFIQPALRSCAAWSPAVTGGSASSKGSASRLRLRGGNCVPPSLKYDLKNILCFTIPARHPRSAPVR